MSRKEEKRNEAMKTILKGGVPDKDIKFFTTGDSDDHREVGETWVDEDGHEWEQRKGYRIKKGKHEIEGMPLFCPECDGIMNKQIDDKMYYRMGMCSDCVIEMETTLRAQGKYELYEKMKVLNNMKSHLREMEQGVEVFYDNVNNDSFVNEFGVEKWSKLSQDEIEEMKENSQKKLDMLRDDIEELEENVSELKEEHDVETIDELLPEK